LFGGGVYMGYGLNGYILLYGAKIQVENAFKFKGLENACKESPMKMKKVKQ